MIIHNTVTGKKSEYIRYDDILENDIKITKLNIIPIERKLLNINKGKNRRIKNNHQARLDRFKLNNK